MTRKPKYIGRAVDGPAKGKTLSSSHLKIKVPGALAQGGYTSIQYDWQPTSDGGVWFSGVDGDGSGREKPGEAN